jgi:GT2 family glycosyltransferase
MFHAVVPQRPAGYRPFLPTLNLSVHRSVWERVGGMDETLPVGEDMDWTIRMRKAGYNLYFEPEARVRHAPTRESWHDVRQHWEKAGRHMIRVRLRHADDYGTPGWARSPMMLRMLAPAIAALITGSIYARRFAWRYWANLPAVFASKVIYCWSAAAALEEDEQLRAELVG